VKPKKARGLPNANLRFILILGVFIALCLVLLGWALVPTINPLSVIRASLILVIYGIVFYFALPKVRPETLLWGAISASIAGFIFAAEIVSEYVFLPKDNTLWGYVEFGGVFLVYFLTALFVSLRTNRMVPGITSSVASGMISAVVWLIVVLITFYSFRGTAQQVQVFSAEGNYEDFARSGTADFNRFIMEDFLGASFFHPILGPLASFLLGVVGSLLGKGIGFVKRRRGQKNGQ
jgi:hypothetical protein